MSSCEFGLANRQGLNVNENGLAVFENATFGDVRVKLDENGEPWFVAADVCKALEIVNNRDAISKLDDDEKGVASTDTLGGKQEMTVVNEPGLYSLVLGSRKKEAKAFKRWITHEVIPAIRKHGGYLTLQKMEEALLNPDVLIRLATDLKAEREAVAALKEKNGALEEENAALAKKVLKHEPRELVNRIIRRIAAARFGNKFSMAWNLWKRDMLYLKGISLANRRYEGGTMLDCVREDEWDDAVAVAVAMAKDFDVNIETELRRWDAA